jgi:hypothetical protein
MAMVEIDYDEWVRWHSLLRFSIPPKSLSLINGAGIVEDGFFYEDVPHPDFLLLSETRRENNSNQVYVCLEIDAGKYNVTGVGSFGCRFGYPIMHKQKGSGRHSYVWQVSHQGCIDVTLNGKKWRIWHHNQRVSIVEPSAGNRIVAEDIPYGRTPARETEVTYPHPTPAHHSDGPWNIPRLLDLRQSTLEGLYWIERRLNLLGHCGTSRYSHLDAVVGTTMYSHPLKQPAP